MKNATRHFGPVAWGDDLKIRGVREYRKIGARVHAWTKTLSAPLELSGHPSWDSADQYWENLFRIEKNQIRRGL